MIKEKAIVLPKPVKHLKIAKNRDIKGEQKIVETVARVNEPRVTKKLRIVSVENVNNIILPKRVQTKLIEPSNLPTKVINRKRRKSINDATDEIKMAPISRPEEEARVQPIRKKPKIRKTNESSVIKTEETIKEVKTKSPVKTINVKKEQSIKETKKSKKSAVKKEETVKEEEKTKLPVKTKKVKKEESVKAIEKIEITKTGHLKLRKAHILKTIEALVEWSEKKEHTKKSLLPMENQPILLQVTCIKIPSTPRRHIRPILPHPLAGPLDDIAIFVPDEGTGRRQDYEKTVEHWETVFREKGVDCIKEIIPMIRVKTEYSQFEMKRKLAGSFDFFLADGRICGHLSHLLGKHFTKRQKPPTPVHLTKDNLKEEINRAIRKTCMEIHSYGNSHTVRVAALSMEPKKIAANVWAICETLADKYPGGWANIRAINIKTQNSPAIPIYMTMVSKNDVPVPVVKGKRPKAYKTVEGELSTIRGNVTVSVTPEGRVKINKKPRTQKKEIKEADEDEKENEKEDEQ